MVPLGGLTVTAEYPLPAVIDAQLPVEPEGRVIVQALDACTTVRVFMVRDEPGHVVVTSALAGADAFAFN
jgi:hypothetical protein